MTVQTCLTRVEATHMLGISLATRDRLIKAGHLPVIQRRHIPIRSTTLDAWLERDEGHRSQAVEPEPPDRLPAAGAQAPTGPAPGKERAR